MSVNPLEHFYLQRPPDDSKYEFEAMAESGIPVFRETHPE